MFCCLFCLIFAIDAYGHSFMVPSAPESCWGTDQFGGSTALPEAIRHHFYQLQFRIWPFLFSVARFQCMLTMFLPFDKSSSDPTGISRGFFSVALYVILILISPLI